MNWIGLAAAVIILLVSLVYAYVVLFVEIPQMQKQRRDLEESTERIKEDTRRIRENTLRLGATGWDELISNSCLGRSAPGGD